MKRDRKKSGRGMTRKVLAAFLAASVLLAQVPMAIYAEGTAEKGLCAHHTQHTEECGYREAKAAVPCGHICSAESGCITTAKSCTHTHGAECYPEGNTEGEPSLCTHACSEGSGCMTKTESCVHTHDASCGYAEAVEAKECKYAKESCPDCEAEARAAAESEAARKAAEEAAKAAAESEAARKAAEESERAAAEEAAKAEQEKQQKIQTVQALIDVLPEADGITDENLETVKGQISAIEEAKAGLDESSQTALNLSKYTAAAEKAAAVEAEQEAARKAAEESERAAAETERETETETETEIETESETETETETEKPKPKKTQKKAAAATGAASVTIGNQTEFYDTLQDALNAANGQTATITVLKDVNESSLYFTSLSGNITLIGGNHTIKFKRIDFWGSLTVESGNITGELYTIGGTLNVKGGEVSNAGNDWNSGGTINIYGGTVSTIYNEGDTVNIYGGDVGTMENMDGTVNIYGGTVNTIYNADDTVNIYGGDVGTINNMGGTVNDYREYAPKIFIDYVSEELTEFETGKTYTITYTTAGGEDRTLSFTSNDGTYSLEEEMLGTLFFISGGENAYQSLLIPERPIPEFSITATASTLTASSQASGIEYSFDGGAWGTAAQWTGLKGNSTHTIKARIPASDSRFQSEESQPQDVTTLAASYTITIPAEVTAGGTAAAIEPTALDLGAGSKVAVSVSGGLDNNGKVILTRDGAQNQIFAPLSADGGTLTGATPTVGNITGMSDKISLSVGPPATADSSQILAGAYTGNVTFTYEYSEQ